MATGVDYASKSILGPYVGTAQSFHSSMVHSNRTNMTNSTLGDFSKLTLDGSDFDDVEALPSSRKIAPTQHYQAASHSLDPDLCITPEKTSAFQQSKRTNSASSFRSSRSSLKVRFDDVVNVHQLTVDESAHENVNDSDSSEDEIIEVIKYDYQVNDSQESESVHEIKISPPRSIDVRGTVSKNMKETETINSNLPTMTCSEHALARPEFHSTLRNMKKIQGVQKSELNVATALKKEIQESDKAQKQVAEKASTKVDVDEELLQYVDLVGVNVPEDEVISAIVKERAAQVKPTHKLKSKPEDYVTNPPDLMEFFTDDLQKEFPSWTLPGIKIPQPSLTTADPIRAFDIYQHIRMWENE